MNLQLKFSLITIVFSVFLTACYFLFDYLFDFNFLLTKFDFAVIYGSTFVTLFVIAKLLEIKPNAVGYSFLSIGVIKLIGISLYLMKDILDKDEHTVNYVLQFFAVYFVMQFFELIVLGRKLNSMIFSDQD